MSRDLRASIDIGSNSVLLLVCEMKDGKLNVLLKRSEVTALGRELDRNKVFHPDSMSDTYEVIKSYVQDCEKLEVPKNSIVATATEASRVASNAKNFFQKIEEDLGITINIITPLAEAYFSTRGILFETNFPSEIITIMDIGGASTELIRVNTKTFEILEAISMPIGAVRCSQWLNEELFVQNLQKVFHDFRGKLDKFQGKDLYCVAGTVTSLGNMFLQHKEFEESEVHGLVLKAEDLDNMFKRFSNYTPEQFLSEFPFLQKRAHSIRGGLHLVYHILHRLLVKQISISTYGLRYGTLIEGKIKREFLHE